MHKAASCGHYIHPSMFRITLLLIILFALTLFHQGCIEQSSKQSIDDNAYLFRKHIDKDSTWIEPNTNCYYLENAGMNMNHGGWHWAQDLEAKETNFFYWEAETFGMVKLEFDLPKEVVALNFDTISKLNYDFINYYCGDARTDSTVEKLSGILTFTKSTDKEITIDGKINIDTEKPVTHQEIVFKKYRLHNSSLSDVISDEQSKSEEWRNQIKKDLKSDNFISSERQRFYDSIFNVNLFPKNKLKANINNKSSFDFQLSKSYILTNVKLSGSIKEDMTEVLEGNPVIVELGNKNVFVFHSLHDPVKNSIDDEINYSLNIELDSIVLGKLYHLNNRQNEFIIKLLYWHYGPNGILNSSKETSGALMITENNTGKVSGTINLHILNTDKTHFYIKGDFELPKIKLNDISDFENNLNMRHLIKLSNEE